MLSKGFAVFSVTPAGKGLKAANLGFKLVRKSPFGKIFKAKKHPKNIDVAVKGTGNVDDLINSKSLGKGSTGRTVPNNLKEQLAMKEVLSNPLKGATRVPRRNMKDPRWLASEGWVKMQSIVKNSEGNINIHFNYNTKTGKFDDFKFK